jgi:NADPH:quinone reductase
MRKHNLGNTDTMRDFFLPFNVGKSVATYSGVFTLLPLLSGNGRANHGHILQESAALANKNRLKPLLAEHDFGTDIASAYDAVANASKGKVVLELF